MGQLPCVRPVSIVLLFCPIVKSNSVCHRSLFQDGQIPLWKEYHKERLASEIYHFGCSWLKCLKLFLLNFLFELNLRIGLLMMNNIGQQFQKNLACQQFPLLLFLAADWLSFLVFLWGQHHPLFKPIVCVCWSFSIFC